MEIKGNGILRHQFFLEYGACISLWFGTEEEAQKAKAVIERELPEALRNVSTATGGQAKAGVYGAGSSLAVYVHGEDLEAIQKLFGGWGADTKDMVSMETSIDHGKPFSFTVKTEQYIAPCQDSTP